MARIPRMTPQGDMLIDMERIGLHQVPERLFFWTSDRTPVDMKDWYRGTRGFLVCNGPSLVTHDLSLLKKRGVLTMGMNNGWAPHIPNLWVGNDHPGRFCDDGWRDPTILKFTPAEHLQTPTSMLHRRLPNGTFKQLPQRTDQMPNILYFIRNQKFEPSTFLTAGAICYGRSARWHDNVRPSGVSTMLQAIRIMYHLGIRTIFLLGADFKMVGTAEQNPGNYAFEQMRTQRAVDNNNRMYEMMNWMFADLAPMFKLANLSVWNCTPNSGLQTFPHMPYLDAVTSCILPDLVTDGWYSNERNPT